MRHGTGLGQGVAKKQGTSLLPASAFDVVVNVDRTTTATWDDPADAAAPTNAGYKYYRQELDQNGDPVGLEVLVASVAQGAETYHDVFGGDVAVGGLYPNRPESFLQSTAIDFSQAPPAGPAGGDRDIVGTDWKTYTGDATFSSRWSKQLDAGALGSPPDIWRGRWAPGSYGGGVIGAGGGHGIGNVFTYGPGNIILTNPITRLYLSIRARFVLPDATYWHPISNKFVNIVGNHSQILMQLRESADKWRHAEELGVGGPYTSFFVDNGVDDVGEDHIPGVVANPAVPINQRVHIELLIDIPNHIYKIWQDGVLTTDAAPNFASTNINTIGIYAFRGGGGETLDAALDWEYDHFLAAW